MLANFVQETANNPGAATTFNLAGPATGRRGFLAVFGSGAVVDYVIDDGTQYEYGIGTINPGSPVTLTRTTVIENSAGTTARLNFTGAVRVYSALSMTRVAWVQVEAVRVVAGVAQADFALPLPFRRFRLTAQGIVADTTGRSLGLRFSIDGGATFISTAAYQYLGGTVPTNTGTWTGFAGSSPQVMYLTAGLPGAGNANWDATAEIAPGSASLAATMRATAIGSDGTNWLTGQFSGACGAGARCNAMRIYTANGLAAGTAAGTFSGTLILEGMR